jgi:hypothetical protein
VALTPPATMTTPFDNKDAVWKECAVMRLPVADHVAATGSYNWAVEPAIFPWLAMTGSLVVYGAVAMAIGAVLFALSFALRSPD